MATTLAAPTPPHAADAGRARVSAAMAAGVVAVLRRIAERREADGEEMPPADRCRGRR